MRRVIAVTLDGLRRDFVTFATTPNLAAFRERGEFFSAHQSVAPSATRVVSSSFATGCYPAKHGLEGNSLALMEDGRLLVHDAGRPDFLLHRRCITGRSLDRPTLSEYVADIGGAAVFSNVSPGAAFAHDPDGFGHVFHRVASYGPGRKPHPSLPIEGDMAGDRLMTDRFIETIRSDRPPAYALLWLGEPDTSQHAMPLGSPQHLDLLRAADANIGRVFNVVDELRQQGEDVLFIVGSDHGHQSVKAVIDVNEALAQLGFAKPLADGDLVVAPNGTAVLVYATESWRTFVPDLIERVSKAPWAGDVVGGDALPSLGHTEARNLALFIGMAADDAPNAFGVRGLSYAAKPLAGKPDRLGTGQHGGLGRYEQSPFLIIDSDGFALGAESRTPTSPVDIAPTILTHLGLARTDLEGRALQLSNRPAS